ncbi:MAG: succinate dehydrogenase assembly factor 2 [Pseudolabrys sp.]|nr:succinate dehydrogenase assembly factor 2 [Pseudolabrys sp.]
MEFSVTTRSSEGLDERRRKLLFRAWHTGIREVDLVLGPFADARIAEFDDAGLDAFEQMLSAPSPQLLDWVMNDREPDDGGPLVLELRRFHRERPKG